VLLGEFDLPYLFRDFGVAVVKGAEQTTGILDDGEGLVVAGFAPGMTGRELGLTLRTGALTGLAVGSALTVGGTAYVVRERLTLDDGKLTRCLLENP